MFFKITQAVCRSAKRHAAYGFTTIGTYLGLLGACTRVRCRPPDLYHSCYALSGLSISQYAASRAEFSRGPYVYGCWKSNLLQQTDPFYNVCCTHMQECREQLKQLPRFTAPDTQHAGQEGDLPRLSAELTDKLSRAAINLREDEGKEMWHLPCHLLVSTPLCTCLCLCAPLSPFAGLRSCSWSCACFCTDASVPVAVLDYTYI